ncbi:MAG: hypothetical protein ACOYLB_00600 [Phototrophicaceae bacterium]
MPPSPCPFPRSALPTREGVKRCATVWMKVPSPTSEAQWGRAREGAHFVGEGVKRYYRLRESPFPHKHSGAKDVSWSGEFSPLPHRGGGDQGEGGEIKNPPSYQDEGFRRNALTGLSYIATS